MPSRCAAIQIWSQPSLCWKKHNEECWIIDIDSSNDRCGAVKNLCPCMTKSRPLGFWVSNRGRRLTIAERMRLQGMVPGSVNLTVPDTMVGAMLGNTMSVMEITRSVHCLVQLAATTNPYPYMSVTHLNHMLPAYQRNKSNGPL